jgi:hydroxyacylglutathione hydrolase
MEPEAGMIVKQFYEESLAQSAYLIGCAASGEALVIDPTIDIGPYLAAAEAEGLRITAVAETHIHADFVSGARALATAAGATLYVSGEGGPEWQYAFAHEPGVRVLRNGDVIELGLIRIDVVHTPGHTPEHLMFVVTDTRASSVPLGAFTGDFVFVGDVGRPDLLETAAGQIGTMESSARQLFVSLRTLLRLPDHLLIWPGHGNGSACGKSLGGVPVSSLGYERLVNWALREGDQRAFVASVLEDQPDPPLYFGEMKRVNKEGVPAWTASPDLSAVDAGALDALVRSGQLVIDVRGDVSAGALPGALTIPMGRSFSAWAGSVVPSLTPFFIVADSDSAAAVARRALAIIGRPGARGWISPATIDDYRARGGRLEALETIDLTDHPPAGGTIVDVRSSAEWRAGHLDGAVHVPLARLPERVPGLDRSTPVLVYCQAGVRAAVAASALRRMGFTRVASLAGGLSGHRDRAGRSAAVGLER